MTAEAACDEPTSAAAEAAVMPAIVIMPSAAPKATVAVARAREGVAAGVVRAGRSGRMERIRGMILRDLCTGDVRRRAPSGGHEVPSLPALAGQNPGLGWKERESGDREKG